MLERWSGPGSHGLWTRQRAADHSRTGIEQAALNLYSLSGVQLRSLMSPSTLVVNLHLYGRGILLLKRLGRNTRTFLALFEDLSVRFQAAAIGAMGSRRASSHDDPFTDLTIQEFLDTIDRHSVRGVTFHLDSSQVRTFVPQSAIDDYFNCTSESGHMRVKRLVAKATEYSATKPTAKAVAQRCRRVFTILVIIGRSKYIGSFVGNNRLWDARLPFRPDDRKLFPKLNGGRDFFDEFYKEQWRFCVEAMRNSLDPVTLDDESILPITAMERLDKHQGVSAEVRKITIHPEYDELDETSPDEQSLGQSSHDYVVKSYHHLEAQRYYDAEVGAFQKLHGSGEPVPNLIGYHGAFRQNKSFHIILEYANIGTLEDFFEAVNPPKRGQDIVTLWENLFKLNDALAHIHGHTPSNEWGKPRIFQGWHQDIKPNNILVSGDIVNKPYEARFMLADLGLSHFAAVVEDKADLTGAPERNLPRGSVSSFPPLVKQKSDTWSLGCVYSEVNAWIVDGMHGDWGVKRYRQARQTNPDLLDGSMGACFHNSKGERLALVTEWHGELLQRCATQDHITPILWKELLQPMLFMPEDRLDAQQVRTWSKAVMQSARNKLQSTPSPEESAAPARTERVSPPRRNNTAPAASPEQPAIEIPRTPPNIPPEFAGSPMTPSYGGRVKALHVPDTGQTRGLTHSPDSLGPDASPAGDPANRESLGSLPGSYRNSGTTPGTSPRLSQRISSPYIPEQQQEHDGLEQPSSRHFRETFGYFGTTNGLPPAQEEPLELQGTSLLPLRASHATLAKHFPSGVRNLPEDDGPDPSGKGKAPARAAPKSRKPSKSLSVDQLKTWAELTRNQSIFSSKEHKLAHEDELLSELKRRDHIFVIDDGESMFPYWKDLSSLYENLIYMVKKKKLDPNGSELRFIISDLRKEAKHTTGQVEMVKNREYQRLRGESNFAQRLDSIFTEYQQKLTKKSLTRPISIYVLTDGVWQGGRQEIRVGNAIERMVKFLEKGNYPDNMVGVQFIRFGDDPEGVERLRWLDEALPKERGLKRDICDTTAAHGNVWKMMLGSINDYWDDDPES